MTDGHRTSTFAGAGAGACSGRTVSLLFAAFLLIDTARTEDIAIHFGPGCIADFAYNSLQLLRRFLDEIIKGYGVEIVSKILQMRQQDDLMGVQCRLKLVLGFGGDQM